MIYHIDSIDELMALPMEGLQNGDTAVLSCLPEHVGSGGIAARLEWQPDCTLSHNGGTVIAPEDMRRADEAGLAGQGAARIPGVSPGEVSAPLPPGRWRLLHGGVGDFRYFGIFGPERPADQALEAMVNDPEIKRIEGYTDLRFTKRHKFHRSGLELDFNNCTVTADGIEPAQPNDPFGAIMHFCGRLTGSTQQLTLTEPLRELEDIFEVADSSAFRLYEWWVVTVNPLAGKEEKEIDKLLMVTEIIDATHVRFNYKMGWELAEGRLLTYQKAQPVRQIHVRNMVFWGNAGGEQQGAQPLAFEYAVECNASGLKAYHTYWPVIMRRHNTHYVTEGCTLVNPVEVIVGGTGYLTQQIHCLYGKVRDCTTSNARHLNDFTGSAYCMVENCHGDGDYHGAFVTHGQFEHDLTYIGNSGLISFANSGPTWGESARRIAVKRHSGCWMIARSKVSDLTLEDVHIVKTKNYPQCGTMLINTDGVQIRGCTADKLIFTQRSSRSRRPNVVQDCAFADGIEIAREGAQAVTNKIRVRDEL
ncbi:hypothetical protein DMN77_00935 [Paenibacillus sp. 79R4]|uniref:hypothetical protein n=1 Tax=Paenibacillus sp. 79R4 TaxID=2212847 RepID=UPI0015C10810|nr:hypothetical protein [Paenibacillus sp. 79R4]NWL86159.1 hypothetical protein [Paenibacillus sp. 79R4]